jgi:hypothetical protein
VGTGRRAGGIGAGQLVQHPVRGRGETLQVLLSVVRFISHENLLQPPFFLPLYNHSINTVLKRET